jgi:hypothetical protein
VTDMDLIESGKLYAELIGCGEDTGITLIGRFRDELRTLDLTRFSEAFRDLAVKGRIPPRPAERIGAIVRHARRAAGEKVGPELGKPAFGCQRCGETGWVDVPHSSDWIETYEGRIWSGTLTAVAACQCDLGQRHYFAFRNKKPPCMSIMEYDIMFRGWQSEYPLRRLERLAARGSAAAQQQLKELCTQPQP